MTGLSKPMLRSSSHWHTFWLGAALFAVSLLAFILYSLLGTFVFGLFLYYASRPIYDRLREKIRPPSLAAAAALTVLVLPVVLLFWYTATLAVGQLSSLAGSDLAGFGDLLAPFLNVAGTESGTVFQSILSDPVEFLESGNVRDAATRVGTAATQFLGIFLTGLLHLFIALALAFYLLRDDERLVEWVQTTFDDETLTEYGRAVDADLQTVFFGNILNALLTGVIGAVVFSGLGMIAPPEVPVPVPILLGLLAGLGSLIPIVGMKIVNVPVALYLTVLAVLADPRLLWFPAVFFAVTMIVVDVIPDLMIRPYVSGRDLHIGLVMFSYIFGPLLFGWYGLFLGPLLLVALVHFAGIVVPALTGSDTDPVSSSSPDTGNTLPGERATLAPFASSPSVPEEGRSDPSDSGDATGGQTWRASGEEYPD